MLGGSTLITWETVYWGLALAGPNHDANVTIARQNVNTFSRKNYFRLIYCISFEFLYITRIGRQYRPPTTTL